MIHNFLRSLFKRLNMIKIGLRKPRWVLCITLFALAILALPSTAMIYASPQQTHNTTEIKYHTVGVGDTLTKIARRYGVSVGAIQNANGLDDADFIRQGQKLRIPVLAMPSPDDVCVRYHRVEAGEVLSRIALNYGVTVQALLNVNNLKNADNIRSGMALCIPNNRPATQAPTTAPTRTQAASNKQEATPLPTNTPSPEILDPIDSSPVESNSAEPNSVKDDSSQPLITYRPSANQRLQPTDYLYIQIGDGDTMPELADKYEVELDFLLYLNQIPATQAVEVGQTIVIPLYDEEAEDELAETPAVQPNLYATVKASIPPTEVPTKAPPESPTEAPTERPTEMPTEVPTEVPTEAPTEASTDETAASDEAIPADETVSAIATPTILPTKSAQLVATPTPVSVLKLLGEFTVVGVKPGNVLYLYGGESDVINELVGQIPPAQQALNGYAPVIIIDGVEWMFVGMETMGWADSNYLAPSQGQIEPAAATRANEILFALRNQDMEQLAQFVHPEGVRFSPYSYLERRDLIFMPSELPDLPEDSNVYRWGVYDGSGEAIEMTWAEYYASFIWSADFTFPDKVGYDNLISHSNMIDNHKWIYPESVTVEYHFEGFDPEYGGLDWRSLRLVLEEVDGEWLLVAIINDQWTI